MTQSRPEAVATDQHIEAAPSFIMGLPIANRVPDNLVPYDGVSEAAGTAVMSAFNHCQDGVYDPDALEVQVRSVVARAVLDARTFGIEEGKKQILIPNPQQGES
jgi:hypothetical protein